MAETGGKRVVVLAVDSSKQCQHAIDYYTEHIHKPENHVLLVHIVELPDMTHARQSSISPMALSEMWNDELVKAKELEIKIRDMLIAHGVGSVTARVEGGMKPGHSICHVAEEVDASMIVMGTRGLGTIRRTVLGSVSDHIVHHAHCPVVICRGEQKEHIKKQKTK